MINNGQKHVPYTGTTKLASTIGAIAVTGGAYSKFIAEVTSTELTAHPMILGLVILACGFFLRTIEIESFYTKK